MYYLYKWIMIITTTITQETFNMFNFLAKYVLLLIPLT